MLCYKCNEQISIKFILIQSLLCYEIEEVIMKSYENDLYKQVFIEKIF